MLVEEAESDTVGSSLSSVNQLTLVKKIFSKRYPHKDIAQKYILKHIFSKRYSQKNIVKTMFSKIY